MPDSNAKPSQPTDELAALRQQIAQLEAKLALEQPITATEGKSRGDFTIRTLLESLAEGIIVIDRMGAIVLVNKRTAEIFGYDVEEIVGRTLNILLPERFSTVHLQYLETYFQAPWRRHMGQEIDWIGKRKDNSEFPVEISLSALHIETGVLAIAFVTDITLRKQVKEKLKLRNEELDAFAHTVAHDLKAALALIVGYSDTLVHIHETLSPPELRKYLNLLVINGRKMSNIINELLLFASTNKEDVATTTLNMTDILAEVRQRLGHEIETRQAEIIQPSTFPNAVGYAPWVEEVWFNYLSNGLRYGGNPPRLELGSTQQDDGYIQFWLKDNGAGLTKAQQQVVFSPLNKSNLLPVKGHGLGLSIVRRIVEKLGGQVYVEGEVGQGSCFGFTLPAAE